MRRQLTAEERAEKKRLKNARYYEKHRDALLAKKAAKDEAKRKPRVRASAEELRERKRARDARWYAKNRDARREAVKHWKCVRGYAPHVCAGDYGIDAPATYPRDGIYDIAHRAAVRECRLSRCRLVDDVRQDVLLALVEAGPGVNAALLAKRTAHNVVGSLRYRQSGTSIDERRERYQAGNLSRAEARLLGDLL